jgi:hypothetical protein
MASKKTIKKPKSTVINKSKIEVKPLDTLDSEPAQLHDQSPSPLGLIKNPEASQKPIVGTTIQDKVDKIFYGQDNQKQSWWQKLLVVKRKTHKQAQDKLNKLWYTYLFLGCINLFALILGLFGLLSYTPFTKGNGKLIGLDIFAYLSGFIFFIAFGFMITKHKGVGQVYIMLAGLTLMVFSEYFILPGLIGIILCLEALDAKSILE